MNLHIAHVMGYIPAGSLKNKIFIGEKGPYCLDFIVPDYVEHLKHHLKQILPSESFLDNRFTMVYWDPPAGTVLNNKDYPESEDINYTSPDFLN